MKGKRSTVFASLFSWTQVAAVWAPVALITVLHYASPADLSWLHDVLRRLYYIPIVVSAFACGLPGGLFAASAVILLYVPHAFLPGLHSFHHDPGRGTEKLLEILLYLAIGIISGVLVDRERRERRRQEDLARELERTLEDRRAMEAQIVAAGKLAALGELTAGIAHEVRNPLHAMRSTAELVLDALPEGAEERRLQQLHLGEIDRLGRVAERFLSFARPGHLEKTRLDLADLLARVRELAIAQARRCDVELAVNMPGRPMFVEGDREALSQVLLNVVLNAFAAIEARIPDKGGATGAGRSGRKGTILLSTGEMHRGTRTFAIIRVVNDGPPIPADSLPRIFDPFVTTRSEGTGLGLSIASRIVHAHDGFLEAANLPEGAGVEFRLGLPVEP